MIWMQWTMFVMIIFNLSYTLIKWGDVRPARVIGGQDLVVGVISITIYVLAGALSHIIGWPTP